MLNHAGTLEDLLVTNTKPQPAAKTGKPVLSGGIPQIPKGAALALNKVGSKEKR